MTIWWLLLLLPCAFIGALLWRRRIDSAHNTFKTKMDLAGDEDHTRQQLQRHYEKQQQKGRQ